jgi:hypothetical protein
MENLQEGTDKFPFNPSVERIYSYLHRKIDRFSPDDDLKALLTAGMPNSGR